jgi:hypothetical protein
VAEKIVKDLQKVDIYKEVKRKYIKNEEIDLNTGSLILYYTNGTNEEIKLNDPRVKVTKFDTSKIGKSNDLHVLKGMLKFVGSRRPSFNMLIVTLLEFIDIISKIYPKDSTILVLDSIFV